MKSDKIIGREFEIKESSIDGVIKILQECKSKYEKYGAIYIEPDTVFEYGDYYSVLIIKYNSPETDEEYEKRIAHEVAKKTDIEYRERMQYERLKEKYGD